MAFQKARKAFDIKALIPLIADEIRVTTPQGSVEGRDAFLQQIKCATHNRRLCTRSILTDETPNRKDGKPPGTPAPVIPGFEEPKWGDYVENPEGTFVRDGKFKKVHT